MTRLPRSSPPPVAARSAPAGAIPENLDEPTTHNSKLPTVAQLLRIVRNLTPYDPSVMNVRSKLFAAWPLFAFACCGPQQAPPTAVGAQAPEQPQSNESKMTKEFATFGGGCFWCTEAVLEQLDGVLDVESGYTGGTVDNPTYEQICGGRTEHAEVVKVTFDPKVISYESLLDWFFRSHDPTTLNRQGNDVGTQYRSAIFFHSKEQHQTALRFMEKIANNWSDPIVTELTPAVKFWSAETYHQDYFRNNQNQGYCRVIIKPKLAKLGLDDAPKK